MKQDGLGLKSKMAADAICSYKMCLLKKNHLLKPLEPKKEQQCFLAEFVLHNIYIFQFQTEFQTKFSFFFMYYNFWIKQNLRLKKGCCHHPSPALSGHMTSFRHPLVVDSLSRI